MAAASAPNRAPEVLVAQVGAEQDVNALNWHQIEPICSEESTPGSLQAPLDGLEVLRREVSRSRNTYVSECVQ